VQVRIFDHGLEVWNPGTLPAGLTVDDLRRNHESKPRNKLIARVFFLIRYIEQFGTGTGRMIEECRMAGIPEPEFESRAGSFRVLFQKTVSLEERLAELKLNKRQLKAVRYAEQHGLISRKKYEEVTGAPTATAKRDLSMLVKVGVLISRGRGRSVSYELSAQIMSRKVSRKGRG
ncbi:MAG: ATP-binding protein, partial [Dehalococcoidales bacterium]|nr:ATP-binding protein [Dehalococcoidales bacterium]